MQRRAIPFARLVRRVADVRRMDLTALIERLLDSTTPVTGPSPRRTRRWIAQIALIFAALVVLGPLLTWRTVLSDLVDRTKGGSAFYIQYQRHEPLFLAVMAAFALVALIFARSANRSDSTGSDGGTVRDGKPWHAAVLAAVVFGLTTAGTWAVMHRFPLAMDEFVAEFQARIFAAGGVTVSVPPEWQQLAPGLRPTYVGIEPNGAYWTSSYWPVYSGIRALFLLANADAILNPLFAAVSVMLVFACARRMWPDDSSLAWLAAAFLASSSQLLFMSMTAFSMPAHLCFALLWLYALLRDDRAGWIAAPIIGVLALGLHNPFPHALFAAPFLLQVVTRKRWGWIAYFAVVYGIGIAAWLAWMLKWQSPLRGPIPAHQLFELPGVAMLLTQGLSFSIFLTWQTPLLAVLFVVSTLAWRWLSGTERCLVAGVLLSFAFHTFLYTSQGHGWGYRYAYATLGGVALLGAGAMRYARKAFGEAATRRLVVASLLVTGFIQFPVRAWQIEAYVRPFARVHEYIAKIDADVVIVDPTSSWYGIDLIRNDPFLKRRPAILSSYFLQPATKHALVERFGERVHLLEPKEIEQFGLPTFESKYDRPVWPPSYPTKPRSYVPVAPAAR